MNLKNKIYYWDKRLEAKKKQLERKQEKYEVGELVM